MPGADIDDSQCTDSNEFQLGSWGNAKAGLDSFKYINV